MGPIRLLCAGLALALLSSIAVAQEAPPEPPPAAVPPAPPPFPNFGSRPAARHHGAVRTTRHVSTVKRSKASKPHREALRKSSKKKHAVAERRPRHDRHHVVKTKGSHQKAKRGRAAGKHETVKRNRHEQAKKRDARRSETMRHREVVKVKAKSASEPAS